MSPAFFRYTKSEQIILFPVHDIWKCNRNSYNCVSNSSILIPISISVRQRRVVMDNSVAVSMQV